jgi:hypothetical protein
MFRNDRFFLGSLSGAAEPSPASGMNATGLVGSSADGASREDDRGGGIMGLEPRAGSA